MRGPRAAIGLGMAGGALWGLLAIWLGQGLRLPVFALGPALALAYLGPGLVTAAMIGRLAQRRFFDDGMIDGDAFAPGSAAEIDARVLQNTVEQLVLALCIWPALAFTLGPAGGGVTVALGLSFTLARALFWAGYRRAPALRALGFAATFYPTVMAGVWALWRVGQLVF